MKRLLVSMFIALTFALGADADRDAPEGHGRGHAPEMTDVAMGLAGLTSLGGYLIIRKRSVRKQ